MFWKSAGVARWAYNYFLIEQEKAYKEYLEQNNEITTAKGVEITGKSEAQVRRYLKSLCNVDIIQSTKTTKGNVYIKKI